MDLQKSRSKGWSHRCHFIKEIKNSDWGSLVQQQLKFTPQTQTNILSFTFKPLLVYLCKWGPCSRRCNKSTTVYMMSFDTIRSHSNYEGMTLLVTTWTNVFRDQRQPDSSNWVMASHPPSLLLMNEGLCRLLHADDRWPVCYRPPVERKKKEENETVFFCILLAWEQTKWISVFRHQRENASSVFALMWLIQWNFDMINSSVMMSWRWPQKLHTSRARAL